MLRGLLGCWLLESVLSLLLLLLLLLGVLAWMMARIADSRRRRRRGRLMTSLRADVVGVQRCSLVRRKLEMLLKR
jgi:flagellar biogenesis protein FliO